jgi:hypothetical protein
VPGFVITSATVAMCPHGGQVAFAPSQSQLMADSAPAILVSDVASIAGCPFVIAGAPSPCLTIQWTSPATRAGVQGTPVLLSTSIGLCMSPAAAPQGSVIFASVQARVQAA